MRNHQEASEAGWSDDGAGGRETCTKVLAHEDVEKALSASW
jgi:hypothetical protein